MDLYKDPPLGLLMIGCSCSLDSDRCLDDLRFIKKDVLELLLFGVIEFYLNLGFAWGFIITRFDC
jgi:hypothetical protein